MHGSGRSWPLVSPFRSRPTPRARHGDSAFARSSSSRPTSDGGSNRGARRRRKRTVRACAQLLRPFVPKGTCWFGRRARVRAQTPLAAAIPPMTMREQVTSNFSVTIAHHDAHPSARGSRRSKRMDARPPKRVRHVSMRRSARPGHSRAPGAHIPRHHRKTLRQVDAQLERARSLERAGVLGRVDVLRLEPHEPVRREKRRASCGCDRTARSPSRSTCARK